MTIASTHRAVELLRPVMSLTVEEFWAVALTSSKSLISMRCLFRGTVDLCLVHPRDLVRFACTNNASAVLVAHNHPSGQCLPSVEDIRLTHRLKQTCELIEVPMVDHLILTEDDHFSFLEARWLLDHREPE
ncbi:MAG: JAB domain-containing protein [Bdellovibrionales bacterium]|nr:JAB domain-containing protein [Bdellovibrionales bacterium]